MTRPTHPPPRPQRRTTRRRHVLIGFPPTGAFRVAALRGIRDYLARSDWDITLDPREGSWARTMRAAKRPDGALVTATRTSERVFRRTIRELGRPVVAIERYPADVARNTEPAADAPAMHVPAVNGDNFAIARLAYEHLRGLGLRRFAFCGVEPGGVVLGVRQAGFRQCVLADGLELLRMPARAYSHRPTPEQRRDVLASWLAEVDLPIGVFAANDEYALQVAAACRDAGVYVPDEVAIVGCDNHEIVCELAQPPISSIDHGMRRAGYEAAALLDRLMAGQPAPTEPIVVPPVGVIERQSTNTLAVEDDDIRLAVLFIRDHALEGINVGDVLAAVPVARRRLETGFRHHLGRTVHDEIMRVKIEEARRLLTDTTLNLPDIAARTGFSYATRLCEAFGRTMGTTPAEYRRTHR